MRVPIVYIDRALFDEIAKGNEAAFRQVFYHYGSIIHSFVLRLVRQQTIADEIVQEVFLRLWQKRDSLPGIRQPVSWIYRIASNLAISHLRHQLVEKKLLSNLQHLSPGYEKSPSELAQDKEWTELIDKAIAELPPLRQKIFFLLKEKGLSRKEVAAELKISENTVRNQLSIALSNLRDYILRRTPTP